MSHASVRLLLHDVAKSLADNIQFGYGRKSEFNIIQETSQNHWIWCLPLLGGRVFASGENVTRTNRWDVAMLFLNHDPSDSSHDHSAHVLDYQDSIVARYANALDEWYLNLSDTVGAFSIDNFSQTPIYKENSEVQSGWLVRFQIVTPDDFDYCTPENMTLDAAN
jgi:hypothetical protein